MHLYYIILSSTFSYLPVSQEFNIPHSPGKLVVIFRSAAPNYNQYLCFDTPYIKEYTSKFKTKQYYTTDQDLSHLHSIYSNNTSRRVLSKNAIIWPLVGIEPAALRFRIFLNM